MVTARNLVRKPELIKQMSMVDRRSISQMTPYIRRQSSMDINTKGSQLVVTERTVKEPQPLKARLILLNIVDQILQQYSIQEAGFLKKPIALLACYFSSNAHRTARNQHKARELVDFQAHEKDAHVWVTCKPQQND